MKKKICLCIFVLGLCLTGCHNANSVNETQKVEMPQLPSTEDIVPEAVTPTEKTFDSKTVYGDNNRYIEVLGLKEYASLGKENMKDTPGKGKEYLVLFLNIENRTENTDYINPYNISAKIDGKEVENTYLINDPEKYTTIFTNIEAEGSASGFIVWEVQKNWKKLDFTFDNWKDSDHVSLHATFTPKDLSDPKTYEE